MRTAVLATADSGRQAQRRGSTPPHPRHPVDPVALLALQRTAGNQAATVVVSRVRKRQLEDDDVVVDDRRKKAAPLRQDVYTSQPFGTDGRSRVTRAEVSIVASSTGGRGGAPPPLSQVPAGDDEKATQKPGYDGGHVVGLRLGGADTSENVVPMYRGFNRGPYSAAERAIQTATWTRAPGTPWLAVTCHYHGDNDVPHSFTMDTWLEKLDGTRAHPGRTTLSQPDDIPVVPPLDADMAKIVRGKGKGKASRQRTSKDAAAELVATGLFAVDSLAEAQQTIRTGHLPRSARSAYPDEPEHRPYEYLDLLNLAYRLPTRTTCQTFAEFTEPQRTLILQTNKMRNGGELRSDATDDPVQGPLSERGADNFPEVDHIIPRVLGGSNFYSNARVVSWRLNNVEARIKPIGQLVDLTRLATPVLPPGAKGYHTVVVHYLLRRPAAAEDVSVDAVVAWALATTAFPTLDLGSRAVRSGIGAELATLAERGHLAPAGSPRRYSLVSLPPAE